MWLGTYDEYFYNGVDLIVSLDISQADERLAAYRNLKDKQLDRAGHRFIAEGEMVVRRLLAAGIVPESVLLSRRKAAVIAPRVPEHVPVFIAGDEAIEHIIGFEFHSGVLACAVRPASPPLEALVPASDEPRVLVAGQMITNTENLGALIRTCAAFGAAMILGEHCCDPYFRQAVRVSMGAVFQIPIVRSDNLCRDLLRLRQDFGFDCVAAVLDADATPLPSAAPKRRLAIVLGNEAAGLDSATVAACNRRVTLPMRLGTDSLNVTVAAGVFLYHFTL